MGKGCFEVSYMLKLKQILRQPEHSVLKPLSLIT